MVSSGLLTQESLVAMHASKQASKKDDGRCSKAVRPATSFLDAVGEAEEGWHGSVGESIDSALTLSGSG